MAKKIGNFEILYMTPDFPRSKLRDFIKKMEKFEKKMMSKVRPTGK